MDVAAAAPYHQVQRSTPRAYTSSPPSSPLSPPDADVAPPPTLVGASTTAPKKPRKKKEPVLNEDGTAAPPKEKKPRKPREPKDPNAPPKKRAKTAANADGSTTSKSRNSTPGLSVFRSSQVGGLEKPIVYQPPGGGAPNPDPNGSAATVSGSTLGAPPALSQQQQSQSRPGPIPHLTNTPSYNNNNNNNNNNGPSSKASSPHSTNQSPILPQPPRPASSGQRYDPIRESSASYRPTPAPSNAPARLPISALLDSGGSSYQPAATASSSSSSSRVVPNTYSQSTSLQPSPLSKSTSTPSKPASLLSKAVTSSKPDDKPPRSISKKPLRPVDMMDVDPEPLNTKSSLPNGTSILDTRPPSPKEAISAPGRKKESPPPPPRGSGLLSAASFGAKFTPDNPPAPKEFAEVPNQCIVIEVPMVKDTGNYVNFLKEVEQKYGFDVAHPRLAEHRRRMRDMAAAGAAIENDAASGDEMSLDNSDDESDVDMEDFDKDEAASKKKRKPRKKEDYDKSDAFIDDTELMWEEQALASVDGYFVWSGPLLSESDKASNSKNERGGAAPRRGRGSRGGRVAGSSGRGAKKEGSGRGRGGSGATTTKKPRMKKAEREALEKERERERGAVVTPATFA